MKKFPSDRRQALKVLYDVGDGCYSTSMHWPREEVEVYDAAGLDELRRMGWLVVVRGLTDAEEVILRELAQSGHRVGHALLELRRNRGYSHGRTIKRRGSWS